MTQKPLLPIRHSEQSEESIRVPPPSSFRAKRGIHLHTASHRHFERSEKSIREPIVQGRFLTTFEMTTEGIADRDTQGRHTAGALNTKRETAVWSRSHSPPIVISNVVRNLTAPKAKHSKSHPRPSLPVHAPPTAYRLASSLPLSVSRPHRHSERSEKSIREPIVQDGFLTTFEMTTEGTADRATHAGIRLAC